MIKRDRPVVMYEKGAPLDAPTAEVLQGYRCATRVIGSLGRDEVCEHREPDGGKAG